MRIERLPPTVLLAIGLAALLGASLLHPRLPAMRCVPGTDAGYRQRGNETPLAVFTTVALGGLRGLVTDVLWARITVLQEKGDFVEIAQLADWITKMEPRLAIVWDYHSFNMAYNISVMFSDPADRWRWVEGGIRMLRDEAIASNPGQVVLYDRLCRIFRHKMVQALDPAQPYYRVAWAKEMQDLLGSGFPDYRALQADPQRILRVRDEYKLDPRVMLDIDRTYGSLDWRLPESHIIYWAVLGGRQVAGGGDAGFDIMICDALAEAGLNGQVTDFRPSDGVLSTGVSLPVLQRVPALFEATAGKHGLALDEQSGFGHQYRLFLRQAVVLLHSKQRIVEAREFYTILRDRLHDKWTDQPMDEYVRLVVSSAPEPDPLDERRKELIEHHHH